MLSLDDPDSVNLPSGRSARNVDIRRATIPTTLEIDYSTIEDHATYPIRVTLDNVPPTDFVDPMNSMSGIDASSLRSGGQREQRGVFRRRLGNREVGHSC
ncbi:phenol 2-monooxygenase [Aspergillus udagawae]|uniref:Phenol 2-monooxygenase n=1 Tax=Aspergillus udagawae TaxID=91492 RepID=A0A8H3RIB6_9EURO|nr:phenol 2-monooxygenase [Aspergillus udagawae]